jgi:hypothetical protein
MRLFLSFLADTTHAVPCDSYTASSELWAVDIKSLIRNLLQSTSPAPAPIFRHMHARFECISSFLFWGLEFEQLGFTRRMGSQYKYAGTAITLITAFDSNFCRPGSPQ